MTNIAVTFYIERETPWADILKTVVMTYKDYLDDHKNDKRVVMVSNTKSALGNTTIEYLHRGSL